MPQHADVPLETDILCEHCGYGLNGLPTSGLCPECGEPIADSTIDDGRVPSPWEADEGSKLQRFFGTTTRIILSPAAFFRRLTTRANPDQSKAFANNQHALNAVLLGVTAAIHADTMEQLEFITGRRGLLVTIGAAIVLIMLIFIILSLITKLASLLTRVEGGFWGYRMPAGAVRRVMNFHSAQLLPVSLVAFITVAGYRTLLSLGILSRLTEVRYLFVVCVEVLLGAGYLFRTYWIAMKNIMYANR